MSEHSKERKIQEKSRKRTQPNNDSCGVGNTRRSSAFVLQSLLSRLNMQT